MSEGFSDEILFKLAEVAAEQLFERIKNGEWTAAEMTAALKLLKDNGVTATSVARDDLVDALHDAGAFNTADELPPPADIQVYRRSKT